MRTTEAARPVPAVPRTRRLGALARRDAAVRRSSTALLAAALALPAYWWAADGGVRDLATGAVALTSAGRLSGLVASVLLLAQVLLMARVPALENAWGRDRLTRIHRMVGFSSFTLLLAHIALITVGYAGGSLPASPRELWTLTTTYPGMLLAVAGTAGLVMVVVTSLRAARRRLRYESWHLLHLYAYLGAGLALPHQLWTGAQFVSRPAASVFWWGLWGAAVGAVLCWRVAVPVYRSWRHDLRVTSVVDEGGGMVSVYMAGRDLDRLPVEPGQFLGWRFLGRPGWTRANPWSVSAVPDGRSLRITARTVGDGSRGLRRLQPGTRVLVEGPYGRLTPRARSQSKVLLLGAGSGLAPVRALAEGLEYEPGEATLIARWTHHPLFHHELEALARERGLELIPLLGPRRHSGSWLPALRGVPARVPDEQVLRRWVSDIAERDVYACGPQEWTDAVRRSVLAAGVPAERFHHETFSW